MLSSWKLVVGFGCIIARAAMQIGVTKYYPAYLTHPLYKFALSALSAIPYFLIMTAGTYSMTICLGMTGLMLGFFAYRAYSKWNATLERMKSHQERWRQTIESRTNKWEHILYKRMTRDVEKDGSKDDDDMDTFSIISSVSRWYAELESNADDDDADDAQSLFEDSDIDMDTDREQGRGFFRRMHNRIVNHGDHEAYILLGDRIRFGGQIDGQWMQPSPILARLFYERCLAQLAPHEVRLRNLCIDRLATLNDVPQQYTRAHGATHVDLTLVDIIEHIDIPINMDTDEEEGGSNESEDDDHENGDEDEDADEDEEEREVIRVLLQHVFDSEDDRDDSYDDDDEDVTSETGSTILSDLEIFPPRPEHEMNDPENVHSHGFQASLCDAVDMLRMKYGTHLHDQYQVQQTLSAIERALRWYRQNNKHVEQHMSNAMTTLRVITHTSEGSMYHERQRITEREALVLVWLRLQDICESETERCDILMHQLANNVDPETGDQHCSTGRLARIISALDGIDSEVQLKTSWSITRELNDLIPMLREQFFRTMVLHHERLAYERFENWDMTPLPQPIRNIHQRLLHYVDSQCVQRYPHVSPSILAQWLEPYLSAL